jgi:hypothetical protein
MRALRPEIKKQEGMALIMSLGILVVLTIAGTTATYYATSNTRSASLSKSQGAAYSLAEAGMAEALSKLGAASDPTDSSLLPPTVSTYENGTATYSGFLAGTTWTLTSTGKVTSPTNAAEPARTLTRTVDINGPNVGSLSWHWTRLFHASIISCFDVPVNIPVTVASYLCIDVEPTGSITGENTKVSTGWWIRQAGLPASAVRSAGAGATSGSGTAWTNPGNVVASDNAKATATLSGSALSQNLDATNFGFAIPAGSTIDGVTVRIERMASSSSSIRDYDVRLLKGGSVSGDDKASSSNWPTSDSNATYGDSDDLWGTTLTSADVNSSSFGVTLKARNVSGSSRTASVDRIEVTVNYTGPPYGIGAPSPGVQVAEVNAPGGCSVNGGPTNEPCSSNDFVYADSITENWAVGIKPWTSFNFWWRNTKPGPQNSCTSSSGAPRVFDNDAGSTSSPNESNPTQEITPETTDYTCQYVDGGGNLVGELSWNRSSRVLTVKGAIFFDGSITFGDAAAQPVHYQGRGTIWASGNVTISEPICAGGSGTSNCRTTGISTWDPETNMLMLIAGGEQSWFNTDIIVNQTTSAFQGALYARNNCAFNNAPMLSSPIICTRIEINSTSVSINPWPDFPTARKGQLYAEGTEGDMQLVVGGQSG